MFNEYPYRNIEDLNLDYLQARVRNLEKIVAQFVALESVTFADPIQWNITTQYAKNVVVLDADGDAFISIKPVPTGVYLNNGDYWLEIFNFMDYVKSFNSNLTFNVEANTNRASVAYSVGDWLLLDDILYKVIVAISADDLFEIGVNIEHFTVEDFIKAWINYANGLIVQYKNDIDASELQYRQQLAQDIANTTSNLQSQLNTAISGVTVDSEVINARVGFNNAIYETLHDCVDFQARRNFELANDNATRDYSEMQLSWVTGSIWATDGQDYTPVDPTKERCAYYKAEELEGAIFYSDNSGSIRVFSYDSSFTYLTNTSYSRNFGFDLNKWPTAAYFRFDKPIASHWKAIKYNKIKHVSHDQFIFNESLRIDDYNSGYYINPSDGNLAANAGTDTTGYINVKDYDKIDITLSATAHTYAFYDDNYVYVTGTTIPSGTKSINVPFEATYIRLTLASADYAILSIKGVKSDLTKVDFKIFQKFGVIGDSLSVGYIHPDSRNVLYSWPQYLARKLGNAALNFGYSGVTCATWFTNPKCYPLFQEAENKCQAYIVGIGTNDTEAIGSIADVHTADPSLNPDTFYGNYGKIVSTIRNFSSTAKIFLLTIPYPRYDQDKNDAIIAIAKLFSAANNVYYVDIADKYSEVFEGDEMKNEYFNDHFSAAGYAKCAEIINDAISLIMNQHASQFRSVQNIPYGDGEIIL